MLLLSMADRLFIFTIVVCHFNNVVWRTDSIVLLLLEICWVTDISGWVFVHYGLWYMQVCLPSFETLTVYIRAAWFRGKNNFCSFWFVHVNQFLDLSQLNTACSVWNGCRVIRNNSRDALIIGIGWLVCWYRPIIVHTVGKYKFLFLLPKANKHDSGFRFREKWVRFVTFLLGTFLFCLHSAVLQVSKSSRITIGA